VSVGLLVEPLAARDSARLFSRLVFCNRDGFYWDMVWFFGGFRSGGLRLRGWGRGFWPRTARGGTLRGFVAWRSVLTVDFCNCLMFYVALENEFWALVAIFIEHFGSNWRESVIS
jgi:hypothetical protein